MQAVLKRYKEWDEVTCDAHVQKDSSPQTQARTNYDHLDQLYYLMPEFQSECDSLAVMVNCRKVMTSNYGQVLTEEQKLAQEMQTVLKRLKGKYYPTYRKRKAPNHCAKCTLKCNKNCNKINMAFILTKVFYLFVCSCYMSLRYPTFLHISHML